MNQNTFLKAYKDCADDQTLHRIWQHKINNDIFVELNECNINDLTPVRECHNMERLFVNSTLIDDLKPLIGLPLKELYIENTKVTDISALRKIPTLKRMSLGETLINDLSPLKNLLNLHSLCLNNMPIEDLSPLQGLSLTVLEISHTLVKKLSPLKTIQLLIANNTDISDLTSLKSQIPLKFLDVSSTKVSDISPLKDLPLLSFLYIENTLVSDISPLSKFIQKARTDINWGSDIERSYPTIYVKGCPLNNPPFHIVEQGKEAVLKYWGLEEIAAENPFY